MDFIARFPEDLFPPKENIDEYLSHVLQGYMKMKHSSVTICGICRNISKMFPLTQARVTKIAGMFRHADIFIYENDSTDETAQELKQWENEYIFDKSIKSLKVVTEKVQTEWFNTGCDKPRLQAMANARNHYVDYLKEKGNDTDYTIILDLDILGGYSYDGIAHSVSLMYCDNSINVLGSNSLLFRPNMVQPDVTERVFYDTFAYRALGEDGFLEELSRMKNKLVFERGEKPVEVNSCFGGMAIYNVPFSLKYSDEDCDHVTMHNKMRENGHRVFINPSMITLYTDTMYSYTITNGDYIHLLNKGSK